MTSRHTAVPAREPAPGSGARGLGSGTGDPPPGAAGQPGLGGALYGQALARLLMIALLIAAVLIGLRGGFTLHGWRGPYRRDGIAVGIALEAVLAALLIALLIRGRHHSDDFRVLRLRGALRYTLVAALVIIPSVLLLAKPLHGHPLPSPRPQPVPRSSAYACGDPGPAPGPRVPCVAP